MAADRLPNLTVISYGDRRLGPLGGGGCGANLCTAEVCITAVPSSLNEEVGVLNILVCRGRSLNNAPISTQSFLLGCLTLPSLDGTAL